MAKFIVYACPVGVLAEQIAAYRTRARDECGENEAHKYPPHCTLTGFFHDKVEAVPIYVQALSEALEHAAPTRPKRVVTVKGMSLRQNLHALLLESAWLERVAADFARKAKSATLQAPLRPKADLHLSLALDFPNEKREALARLAREIVDPQAPASWELRFYQRLADGKWMCHQSWWLG